MQGRAPCRLQQERSINSSGDIVRIPVRVGLPLPRTVPLLLELSIGPGGVDDAAADHREERLYAADLIGRHREVVLGQYREISKLAGAERSALAVLMGEPCAALR